MCHLLDWSFPGIDQKTFEALHTISKINCVGDEMWMLWPMVTSFCCKCLFNRYLTYLTVVSIWFDIYNWWQELTMMRCWLEWLLVVHTTARVCHAAARCAVACTTTNHDSQQHTSMTRCNSIKHMWHCDAHRRMLFGNTVVSHNDECT